MFASHTLTRTLRLFHREGWGRITYTIFKCYKLQIMRGIVNNEGAARCSSGLVVSDNEAFCMEVTTQLLVLGV